MKRAACVRAVFRCPACGRGVPGRWGVTSLFSVDGLLCAAFSQAGNQPHQRCRHCGVRFNNADARFLFECIDWTPSEIAHYDSDRDEDWEDIP